MNVLIFMVDMYFFIKSSMRRHHFELNIDKCVYYFLIRFL